MESDELLYVLIGFGIGVFVGGLLADLYHGRIRQFLIRRHEFLQAGLRSEIARLRAQIAAHDRLDAELRQAINELETVSLARRQIN